MHSLIKVEIKTRLTPSAGWVGELEWPEESGGLLEVWSASSQFVYEVLNLGRCESDGRKGAGVSALLSLPSLSRKGMPRADRLTRQITHTNDTVRSQFLLNHRVIGDGDSLTVNLCVTSLVHEFLDGLHVGFTGRNEKFRRRKKWKV